MNAESWIPDAPPLAAEPAASPAAEAAPDGARRRVLSGVLAGVLALVIFGEVNYLAARHYRRLDVTAAGRYSLSQKSKQVLETLTTPIRVTTTFTMSDDTQVQTLELLAEYGQYSENFVLADNVNPAEDPESFREIALRYKVSDALQAVNRIFLDYKGGERVRNVNVTDLVEASYDPGAAGQASYRGEEMITGAILDLTEAKKTSIRFTVGHGERDVRNLNAPGLAKWRRLLETENYKVDALDLAKEPIPEETDALVIAGARDPFRPEEVEALKGYLAGGGRVLILTGVAERPGLDSILAGWGVDLRDDYVVDEGLVGPSGTILAGEFPGHPITNPLEGLRVVFTGARSVDAVQPLPADVTGGPLVRAPESAWGETSWKRSRSFRKDPDDHEGPLPMGVALERGPAPEDGADDGEGAAAPRPARLVVVGAVNFAENGEPFLGAGIGEGTNESLAMNIVGWLTERERIVGVAPKKIDIRRVQLEPGDATVIYLICLALLPGVCLLAGLSIWWSRRG